MAEILITGMDLSEDRQIIITKDGKVLATDWRGISMPTEATAQELPPHGRLVDIDKMKLDFKATVVNAIMKRTTLTGSTDSDGLMGLGFSISSTKTPVVVTEQSNSNYHIFEIFKYLSVWHVRVTDIAGNKVANQSFSIYIYYLDYNS